jgi:hypothetical protein
MSKVEITIALPDCLDEAFLRYIHDFLEAAKQRGIIASHDIDWEIREGNLTAVVTTNSPPVAPAAPG